MSDKIKKNILQLSYLPLALHGDEPPLLGDVAAEGLELGVRLLADVDAEGLPVALHPAGRVDRVPEQTVSANTNLVTVMVTSLCRC